MIYVIAELLALGLVGWYCFFVKDFPFFTAIWKFLGLSLIFSLIFNFIAYLLDMGFSFVRYKVFGSDDDF